MRCPRQLALPLAEPDVSATSPFLEARSNEAVLAWLASGERWPERRLLVWGRPGSGKTHLLGEWARARGATPVEGCRLAFPLAIPPLGLAVDNAETAPETVLLHVINAAAEVGCPLLLAARTPPQLWAVRLADLASRLRATVAAELGQADDALLRALLAAFLAQRQLEVAEPVQNWLLLRLPRTPAALQEVAARLDRLALATGGRVTRGLAATVVDAMESVWHAGST